LPRLSAAQAEALDLLHELAEELCLAMNFVPGDLQFVNNHVIYHARTAFDDAAAQGADRLLYRLWLAMPKQPRLPRARGAVALESNPARSAAASPRPASRCKHNRRLIRTISAGCICKRISSGVRVRVAPANEQCGNRTRMGCVPRFVI